MPSENELTAALMRLCDDPNTHARLHIQAAANHGHMVMLDCAYDAGGLTAAFTEQATSAPESQRILTTMRMDTPSAPAVRRIAYAYHDLIGTCRDGQPARTAHRPDRAHRASPIRARSCTAGVCGRKRRRPMRVRTA
jgi:hypothetical protein